MYTYVGNELVFLSRIYYFQVKLEEAQTVFLHEAPIIVTVNFLMALGNLQMLVNTIVKIRMYFS